MRAVLVCYILLSIAQIFIKQFDAVGIEARISNGSPAKLGQFPWQVALIVYEEGYLHCGGSIISPDWVLTAAHCIKGFTTMKIVFGTIYWKDHSVSMISNELYPHPEFDNMRIINDIGLIRLPSSLTFTAYIQPIALATQSSRNNGFVGAQALVTGFGQINKVDPNPLGNLLQAEVIVISNEECSKLNKELNKELLESHICAVSANEIVQSTCRTDSGGPLIARDNKGNIVQIGIVSYGKDCTKSYPIVYARVSSFMDFISKTTNLKFT